MVQVVKLTEKLSLVVIGANTAVFDVANEDGIAEWAEVVWRPDGCPWVNQRPGTEAADSPMVWGKQVPVHIEDVDDPVERSGKRCEGNKDTSLEVLCLEDSAAGILRSDVWVSKSYVYVLSKIDAWLGRKEEAIGEANAFDEFHAEVARTVALPDFVNGDDLRMLETRRRLGLVTKTS